MLTTPKRKGGLFLASSLCDGLEDNNIRQVMTLLLNKDADPNILIPTHGVTPFHLVIGNDSEEFAEEVTKLFLRHGGNPNVKSNDGMTPVHVAAAWGRINILKLLLANGGDPLCLDNDGRSPFHYAFDGKYFKAVTLLSNYCEDIQDEDDKPKYSMALDKVLITNGDIVAEYVASRDTVSNLDNITMKNLLTDCKSNSSSVIVNSNDVSNVHNIIETKCELSTNNLDEYFSRATNMMTAQLQNNHVTDKKEMSNHSFIDLDFDFANLHLSDVMQKEKCLVSQIINHLSSSLASDCTINETLHNCKSNKREKSDFDMPFELKKNEGAHYNHEYYKNLKDYLYKLQINTSNENILKLNISNVKEQNICSKYSAQNPSRKQHKKNSNDIPVTPSYILDNSIVSMSPNFNTPNHRKRKNTAKTPLTLTYINNDPIVSKSPNFTTPVCTTRKRNPAKTSHVNEYFSTNVFKKIRECTIQTQYSELTRQKKYIAQSTPRRKKKSIYKIYSGKKRFDPYRYESDVTSDEFTADNKLKPVDLNKTIFSEEAEDIRYDIMDTSNEYSLLNVKESSKTRFLQNYCNNCMITKLDKARYDEEDNSESNLLNNSFNQMEKENKSVNNFKEYIKSENYQVNPKFVTIRKNIFKIDKTSEMTNAFINNINSSYTTESDMHTENFIDCVDCDTKKLLNEDLDMDISASSSQNLPVELLFMDDAALIRELRQLGDQPGPITNTTRQLYQRRLMRLKNVRDANIPSISNIRNISQNHTELNDRIKSHLEFGDWLNHVNTYKSLEKHVFQEFVSPDPSRRWREGRSKTSFNYLLLDPRITQDLPNRSVHLAEAEVWSIFLNAIFYIGKGKRSRPFDHLYDAFKTWVGSSTITSKKIKCILDIWNNDHGVICLHIFQNVIPVEAYTREAAMIDAIGREHLGNCKSGEYYGVAATWSMQQKRKFGRYLLYKALKIFLQEGESQLFPQHL
ncbi:hypothetical protein ACFW04_007152 [Cataglyphis niger]